MQIHLEVAGGPFMPHHHPLVRNAANSTCLCPPQDIVMLRRGRIMKNLDKWESGAVNNVQQQQQQQSQKATVSTCV